MPGAGPDRHDVIRRDDVVDGARRPARARGRPRCSRPPSSPAPTTVRRRRRSPSRGWRSRAAWASTTPWRAPSTCWGTSTAAQASSASELLDEIVDRGDAEATAWDAAAEECVTRFREHARHVPGFGHRFHPVDPRRDPLLGLVEARATAGFVAGRHLAGGARDRARCWLAVVPGRVPMNIDGATAIIYGELGFPPRWRAGCSCSAAASASWPTPGRRPGPGAASRDPCPRPSCRPTGRRRPSPACGAEAMTVCRLRNEQRVAGAVRRRPVVALTTSYLTTSTTAVDVSCFCSPLVQEVGHQRQRHRLAPSGTLLSRSAFSNWTISLFGVGMRLRRPPPAMPTAASGAGRRCRRRSPSGMSSTAVTTPCTPVKRPSPGPRSRRDGRKSSAPGWSCGVR